MKNIKMYWEEIGYTPITNILDAMSEIEGDFMIDPTKLPRFCAKITTDFAEDYKVWTELILVLNHKIWQWYSVNPTLGIMYDTMWKCLEADFYDTFEGNDEAISYYYRVTD